ncbi:MAG: hypothetical protein JNJ61_21510 [Anaerolineae bacterium]|nr:hypothetical protein [Anaerolineae bacterium]
MNPNDDLIEQFEAARAELEHFPDSQTQDRARAAFLASASVTRNGHMRHSHHNSALLHVPVMLQGEKKMPVHQSQRLRLAAAILIAVLLAGGIWTIPTLRSLAQEVISFFIRAEDNVRNDEIYVGGTPVESGEQPGGTLAAAIAAAPFDVHVPTVIPNGFRLDSAEFTHGVVLLKLTCQEPWAVWITQRVFNPAEVVPQDIGASAMIEAVDIHGAVGQYVHGTWDVVLPENFDALRQNPDRQSLAVESVWNNDLPWGKLTWTADDLMFEIVSAGGLMSEDGRNHRCAPSREQFSALANGLIANSALASS